MKKSYRCEKLEKSLHFLPNEIKFCCSCAQGLGINLDDRSKLDKEKIVNEKIKYIKELENGIIPKQCAGCVDYREQEKPNLFKRLFSKREIKISSIIVDHFKQCDCNCVYCSQKLLHPNVMQNYELLPLIKQLYEDDMVGENLNVEFQGGNISMLKEFDALMEEFQKNGCEKYNFLINGIKYIPYLEKLEHAEKSFVCISLDSGTRETFAKIKNVDAFEQTVENIKTLEKNTNIWIILKYIIIQGINDNLEELISFLEIAKSVSSLSCVVLEIDYRNILLYKQERFVVPKHYYELFDYAQNYCKENNLPFYESDYVKSVLSKGYCD